MNFQPFGPPNSYRTIIKIHAFDLPAQFFHSPEHHTATAANVQQTAIRLSVDIKYAEIRKGSAARE
jgi:hypothetical protein